MLATQNCPEIVVLLQLSTLEKKFFFFKILKLVHRHFHKQGPSLFAQSFALRPLPQLMPNPRAGYVAREDLGYGPVLDRNDVYKPPVYHPTGQDSFSKRGGSVGFGGVYPIGRGGGRGPRGPPPPSDPGYGYGDYPKPSRPPPSGGYNERASEDGGYDDGSEYGQEYDEYDEQAPPGGRQQQGGSNHEGGSPNYDYGDPVQNGGYHFTGQTQEGDDQGRDSGNQYGGYDESDNHVYGSGQSDTGREYGSGGDGFGSESGGHYGSDSGSGGSQYSSGGHSENSDNDSFENFEGFF